MKIKLKNGEILEIENSIIDNYMTKYNIDQKEAISMYLDDNDISTNKEEVEKQKQDDIDNPYKIKHDKVEDKKSRKKREAKISDEKKMLFNLLKECLSSAENITYEVSIENKLLLVNIGEKKFKIDLIESRK